MNINDFLGPIHNSIRIILEMMEEINERLKALEEKK